MKLIVAFLLGVVLATGGQLLAQSSGYWSNQDGSLGGSYYTGPSGQTDYLTPDGQRGTLYQMPPLWGAPAKSPC
jgi:hypothetical protein